MVIQQQDDKKAEGKKASQRLKHIRKKLLNMTQEEFCEGSKIPKQTYAVWENVRFHGLTKTGAERVLERYQELGVICTISWLLHGVGAPPLMKQDINNDTISTPEDVADELLAFTNKAAALNHYVTDNAMAPLYEQGDIVAGYIVSAEKADGKNCIILFDQGNSHHKTIGRINFNDEGLIISYTNAKSPARFLEVEKIISIAPIIWQRKPQL